MGLKNWAHGPFELLCHAEGHLRTGEDFDRRIALISFDNSIEVSITTYLTLNPMLRGGKSYVRVDVEKWLKNYHSKLEFLDDEIGRRGLVWKVSREDIVWAHDHRNEQYHGGSTGTPERRVLETVREASVWVFGLLFDVPDVLAEIEAHFESKAPKPPVQDAKLDRLIDAKHDVVEVAGNLYYASEVLFKMDVEAYRAAAAGDDEEDS